jgi:flagellar basal-body rod modification protein FlgD
MSIFAPETARNLKSSLADIALPEKQKVEFKETDAEKRIEKQKTEFLTLLTTQLKNQDPFQPMDTNQMSQQIFAINQVEQQLETNKTLRSIHDLLKESHLSNSINYMGKTGYFEGNSFMLADNTQPITLRYVTSGEPHSAVIKILDTNGKEIHRADITPHNGKNTYTWHPDESHPSGLYKFNIEVTEKVKGEAVKVQTFGFGKIGGIISEDNKHYFEINGEKISPDKFSQLVDNT